MDNAQILTAGVNCLPSRKDFSFISFLAKHLFFENITSLRLEAKQQFPNIHPNDLAVSVSLIGYPPKPEICTFASLEEMERNCKTAPVSLESRMMDLQRVKESEGRGIILATDLLLGTRPQVLVSILWHESCWMCQEQGIVSLLDGDCMGWKSEEKAREDGTLIEEDGVMMVRRPVPPEILGYLGADDELD